VAVEGRIEPLQNGELGRCRMNSLLVITPESGKHLSKQVDRNFKTKISYDKGYKFNFEFIKYSIFHKVLDDLFKRRETAFLTSEPTEYLRKEVEAGRTLHRRVLHQTTGIPTVQYRDGCEFSLDLDGDVYVPGFDPFNPGPAIKSWAANNGFDCDITWQITSSQPPFKTDYPRIRLYIQLDKPYPYLLRKQHAILLGADGSVYTATQPNYLAPPRIQGNAPDPIPRRHGFIDGNQRFHQLNELPEAELTHYAPVLGGSVDLTQAQALLDEGKLFRRVLLPAAMSLCNQSGASEQSVYGNIINMVNNIPADKRRPHDWRVITEFGV